MRSILIYFLFLQILFANQNECTIWEGSFDGQESNIKGVPYSSLWIKYCTSDKKTIKGNYSFITLYGNRIDGSIYEEDVTLKGTIDNNTIKIKFYSGFDNRWCNAELKIIDNKIAKWTVLEKTTWDTVKDYLLYKKDFKQQKSITLIQKTQLYKTPSEETITKMYLIAGDKADLLEEKIDEKGVKWYNILYHGKKKDINAWIKADNTVNLETKNK